MKVIKYEQNRGLGIALHDGLLECSNEIVFRMDSDDYSVKDRFEKQLKVFEEKNVDVVGTNITEYDENMEKITSYRVVPETDEDIKKRTKKRNPLNHMTVAYKKSAVIKAGNYQDMAYFEDYYLWSRMIKNGCYFYNIQESLVNAHGGIDMIKRRGGIKYVKPILNFEKALLKLSVIGKIEYFKNIIIRVGVTLVPNGIRFMLYKRALRK